MAHCLPYQENTPVSIDPTSFLSTTNAYHNSEQLQTSTYHGMLLSWSSASASSPYADCPSHSETQSYPLPQSLPVIRNGSDSFWCESEASSMAFFRRVSQLQYHILFQSHNLRMLTQVRTKKREKEKAATLEIHPEIQVRLQLSRFADNKNQVAKSSEKKEQKVENKQVGETNQNDEQSFRSFLKYESLPSPPGRSRRNPRPSSYQLYKQQQKTLKQTHYSKINQWKAKLLNAQPQKDSINKIVPTFTRTHSTSQTRSLHKRQITMPFRTLEEVVAVQPIQHPSFRSNYIKTSEGRRKMVDNNTYLRKLKARIEFYSLSAIITERHNMRIRGAEGANVQTIKQEEKRGSTQESRLRNYIKYGKSKTRPRNGSNGDIQGCRPWSGFKEDFSNELSSLV